MWLKSYEYEYLSMSNNDYEKGLLIVNMMNAVLESVTCCCQQLSPTRLAKQIYWQNLLVSFKKIHPQSSYPNFLAPNLNATSLQHNI